MKKSRFFALGVFLCTAALVRATSVEPPAFPALVGGADAIYRGRVVSVESRRVERPGRPIIRTYVTFAVERTLKGGEETNVVLDFLGGTVGGLTLEVSDVPQFKVGDRDVLFVQGNGRQFCPLVAIMHGRYHVEHDAVANRDFVSRNNHLPLIDVKDVDQPMSEGLSATAAGDSAHALSLADFETQIVRQVATNLQAQRK